MFIDEIKAIINHQKSLLEPLESGKFKIGENRNDRLAEDHTQTQINSIKRTIVELQSIVDHEDSKRP